MQRKRRREEEKGRRRWRGRSKRTSREKENYTIMK